jgi:hypothetical protein
MKVWSPDTVGPENVGPFIAPFLQTSNMLGTIYRTLNTMTTANSNLLMRDLQSEESKGMVCSFRRIFTAPAQNLIPDLP